MQKISARSLFLGLAFLFALTLVPVAATFAEGGSSGSGSGGSGSSGDDRTTATTTTTTENETETETETDSTPDGLKAKLEELKSQREENKQNRLEANKLRVCENRATRINAIMQRSVTRAEKQITLFDTIATRVEAFYVKKGKTLSNYDQLVAAVNTAKTTAETNLATLKTQDFACDSNDPKGQIEAFKVAVKSVNQDLKNYRTAVKNLIVGVKSVQSTADTSNTEGSQQ